MKLQKIFIVVFLTLAALSATGQEIRRPTADADDFGACTGTQQAGTSFANAYDSSGTSTSASESATGATGSTTTGAAHCKGRGITTWAAASGAYSSLTLNVNSDCTDDTVNDGGSCLIQYSLNGGTSWTTLASDDSLGGWAQRTDTVTISASTSLSNIKVRATVIGNGGCVCSSTGGPFLAGSASIDLFDVWTSGVIAPVNNTRTASETVTISPAVGRNNFRTESDSLTLSPSVIAIHNSVNSLPDSVGVSPTISLVHNAKTVIADSLTISPVVVPNVGLHFSVAESLTASPAVLSAIPRTVSETFTSSDSVVAKQTLHMAFSETVSLSISGVGSAASIRSLAETVSASDVAQRIQALHLSVSETGTVSPSVASAPHHRPLVSESVNLSDPIALGWTRQLPEAVIPVDVAIGSHSIRPTFTETLTLSPSVIGIVPKIKFFTESLSIAQTNLFVSHATVRQLTGSSNLGVEFSASSKTPHAEINNIGQNLVLSDVLVISVHSANKKKAIIVMSL